MLCFIGRKSGGVIAKIGLILSIIVIVVSIIFNVLFFMAVGQAANDFQQVYEESLIEETQSTVPADEPVGIELEDVEPVSE